MATMRPDPRFRRALQAGLKGFVLVEVLLSMTILAIAGTMIMRSFMNAINATKEVRDISKMVFLTQGKLHEYEMMYDRRASAEVELGQFEGRYTKEGAKEFIWRALVELGEDGVMYDITVWTMHEDDYSSGRGRNRRRARISETPGFMLKSMVPAARINDMLLTGQPIARRMELATPRGGNRGGGERGSGISKGGGDRR